MSTRQGYNKTWLSDFPEYTAYYIVENDGEWGLSKNKQITNQIFFRYYCKYGRYQSMAYSHNLLLKKNIPFFVSSTCEVTESDRLLIHPDCSVPRTLISVGKVLSDKSPDTPTKLVIPYNYMNNLNGIQCVLMVNHDAKLVFIIVTRVDEVGLGWTEQEWLNGLLISPELTADFSHDELSGMTMPYGKSVFLLSNFDDYDSVIAQAMIPQDMIITETKLITGEDPLTVDILYSCYKMLDSSDNQIVESACNMLARNRFNHVKTIVRWLLRTYKSKISYYRSKSTAFRWLWFMCINCYKLSTPDIKAMAKELIIKITNNGIHWDGSTMVATQSKWFDYPHVRIFVDAINN
jgi:hypothetical protein